MEIKRFLNKVIASNCYVLVEGKHCIVIDPGSERSEEEIEYIYSHELDLDYIILTHEHTDHTWGVNSLLKSSPTAKVICSENCKRVLPSCNSSFFSLYLNDSSNRYAVERVDYTIEELDYGLEWSGNRFNFLITPGHTLGSICILVGKVLFTGDTLIPEIKTVTKLKGGSMKQLSETINILKRLKGKKLMVYPGHHEMFELDSYELNQALV